MSIGDALLAHAFLNLHLKRILHVQYIQAIIASRLNTYCTIKQTSKQTNKQ